MKKEHDLMKVFLKFTLVLGAIFAVGCGSTKGVMKSELWDTITERGEPKWQATDDADVDEVGATVVTGYATEVWKQMNVIKSKTLDARAYNKNLLIVSEKLAELPEDASEEQQKAVYAEVWAATPDEEKQQILDYKKAVAEERNALSAYLAEIVPKLPAISQKVSSMSSKFTSINPLAGVPAPLKGLNSAKDNIKYIRDCNAMIGFLKAMDADWKEG